MAFSAPSLKGRALRLLGQREHSRSELERKLAKYEEEPGSLARALDELAAKDFISEARVVQSVLHQRAARHGAARVRQELLHKGVAPEAVAEAVASLAASELDRARGVWRQRFGTPPQNAGERARQVRFMLARGFAGAVVAKVLRQDFED
ncbi:MULTISPECIES: recombination regulator RecX [unclassified Variovorax]|uniref:recombination regulator RecX n=1 Tax=unclassified Variovorax TaxID=663243 RepID=UPI00076C007D|nr:MULTISPECIES: recombination regulator RecX [unclassified Variovorax]KWT85741.1 Regulatory protein RecX [Variovorax sp. WDL1]PNG58370.1 Regulatory protein RecX [Variovorax sp. B4]PNG61840.1 Regulatory protein RecX [Variovorax sp. B2]VTV12095.1 Regulatory protein RecX [Variovorax sp. WDL1]